MTPAVLALLAAAGTHLLYTAVVLRSDPLRSGRTRAGSVRARTSAWLATAGLDGIRLVELSVVVTAVALGATGVAWVVFGAPLPAGVVGALTAWAPLGGLRARRLRLRRDARASWPALVEDVRVRTGSLGRSVPVALLEAGRQAPAAPMRAVFDSAQREWRLSTDFERVVAVLESGLADATADAVCETLLVAHELGGADLDGRLLALADDRVADLESRRDAEARQAGARFARWLVLAVPIGMALVGLSIGDGRAAYATPSGQLAVAAGVLVTAVCWLWATAIMRLPETERVLAP